MSFRACDARDLARAMHINKIDDQISGVLCFIKHHASQGEFKLTTKNLYPETVDHLKALGYQILADEDIRATGLIISWN